MHILHPRSGRDEGARVRYRRKFLAVSNLKLMWQLGRAAEAICDYAEKQNADLIITSTHGRTGFMHELIGSVAEHVIRYAHSPVLVVPASGKKIDTVRPPAGKSL